MINVTDIQIMKPLLAEHGFHFSMAKRQNFLIASWVPERIAQDAGVDRTAGVYPTSASGFPWSAASMAVKGDLIADLTEDLAAEQKARVTYDNILRLSDDPDVNDVIKFLRAREVVHFQRFGEGLRLAKDRMNEKNVYFVNPSFDR